VAYEIESQGVTLVREDASELPAVLIDGEQMKQVFLNLILNAVQAMPQGGQLRIATALKREEVGGSTAPLVEIAIQDTGEGMAEDVKRNIFEPFFSTKEEGIGLGLSIAQRIVEEHRGGIFVDTAPGKGTTFFLRFPVDRREW
jgi:signal transduction histidine kinase